MEKVPKFFGIVRIDTGKTHGWEIKIKRRGDWTCEMFSDNTYGGSEQALAAATDRRDQILEALPPKYSRIEIARRMTKKNTSSIVGVRRSVAITKRGNNAWGYPVWEAGGSPRPGVRKIKRFYIAKWGEEDAKAMAIEQRRQWEEEMIEYEKETNKGK